MLDSKKAFVGLAGAILCYQLMLPPVVALADNGDFVKVIARYNLYARVHQTYLYADTVYRFLPEKHWVSDFYSLEIPLTKVAIWVNSLFSKDGNFDIRAIGAVHSALFLWAVWLFAPLIAGMRKGVRWAIYVAALFIFCDMMYVNWLNTFYMDVPAYLFLLLTAVAFLRVITFGTKIDGVMLLLFPFLLVSAKSQHALLGFWIALLFVVTARYLRPIRPVYWYAGAVCLVGASMLMITKAQPWDYASFPLYNVTCEEILPHAKNVDRTLADLGLDESFRFCIGKNSYLPGSRMEDPVFQHRFMQRLSFGKLAIFYVRHPEVGYRTMIHALSENGRQHAFGNFDLSTGFPPETESRAFAFWSDIKSHFFYHRGSVFLFTFLALSGLVCALLATQRGSLPRGALPAGLCLIGACLTEMGTATLCDSMDITRHSVLFFALFDMLALTGLYLVIRPLTRVYWKEAEGGESRHANSVSFGSRLPFAVSRADGGRTRFQEPGSARRPGEDPGH